MTSGLNFFSTSLGFSFNQFLTTIYPDSTYRHDQSYWSSPQVRWLRYQYLWSFYDQTIYWGYFGELIKRELGLYKNIEPCLNSITRLIDFHVIHNMGGQLDRDAGDGKMRPTALPIILGKKTKKNVQPCIAKLWANSDWQTAKSSFIRFGSTFGDVGLELIDDPKCGCIRMRVIHPGEIKRAKLDSYGNVVHIVLERSVVDPDDWQGDQIVTYKEEIKLVDEGTVLYKTFKNDEPYFWEGTPGDENGQWESDIPFIPIRLVQYIDHGFPYGISELAGAIPKSTKLDDQGSNLGDGIRRMVNGPWFLSGGKMANTGIPERPWHGDPFYDSDLRLENFFQLRQVQISQKQDMPIMQSPSAESKMTPLIYPIPVADTVTFITKIGETIGRDYPELDIDLSTASGDASGRALRVARQKVTEKMQDRRSAPDACLAWIQMASCVMGGIIGYDGYEGFNAESMDDGAVDHHIGERPVFGSDPMEILEIQTARATALKTYVEAGFPLRAAMMQLDFQPDDIDTIEDMRIAEEQQRRQQDIDDLNRELDKAAELANQANDQATGSGLQSSGTEPAESGGNLTSQGTTP